ncbi:MAG: Gamma-glutamyl phosphate reductase [Spirochaetes bacterium ADurb.Bin315]|nr:MAG: Gamma-glutamyl phosphate reductase [Spirochaetes bacterium ADurb.Bin315]HOR79903.1 glutamate-5-semialdehyde dehydrogenase [Sphaerochaeta sp.]HPK63265.1 glutamate-5-semialdehyde dehydrogenase [Sphaerochaeta sp.]
MMSHSVKERIKALKESSRVLGVSTNEERIDLLKRVAAGLRRDWPTIRKANEQDVAEAKEQKIGAALIKRLVFDEQKLNEVVLGLEQVAALADPVGKVLQRRLLDDGLILEQISVPIGVIGMIFESRPDALVQIVGLCIKSGNAIILKGGSEAKRTNLALVESIKQSSRGSSLGDGYVTLLESHGDVKEMLKMNDEIDLLIPRGSNAFVTYVMENTSIPVLGHSDGICHLYIDEQADLKKALPIVIDAKTQYPAACNAIETLLVHASLVDEFLPEVGKALKEANVTIHGDERTQAAIECIPLEEGDYFNEYLSLELNIRVVDSLEEAIGHIETYGSHHTDAIVSENPEAVRRFFTEVDSADVFANCSTRFADGFRFGFGAEVGISTTKIHARGPVGLDGLMSTKFLLAGSGQIVAAYSGKDAKRYLHKNLSVDAPSLVQGGSV